MKRLATDERFRRLLTASTGQLDSIDAVLLGKAPAASTSVRLLRVRDVAAASGMSRTTIWRCVREGRLHAVEVRRGSFRISEAELLRFVGGGG